MPLPISIGVLTPPRMDGHIPSSEWVSQVNPPDNMVITLPMKVVCIVKDSGGDQEYCCQCCHFSGHNEILVKTFHV